MAEFFSEEEFRSHSELVKGEYESCRFHSMDLSSVDLSGFIFSNCTFSDCNLSLCKLVHTSFQKVRFERSKLLGLRFDVSNPFGIQLEFVECVLNHSSFYRMNIPQAKFVNCQCIEVDFSECKFKNSDFSGSNLAGAVFDRTDLEGSDFRNAVDFSIDPEKNKITKALFSPEGLRGLLHRHKIRVG